MAKEYVHDEAKPNQRYSDILNEPRKLLLPIDGYQNVALISLEEAVRNISHLLDSDISTKVYIAKENSRHPEDGLTPDESASIHLYTMESVEDGVSLYFILNKTLRLENRQHLKPWFPYLKLLLTGLFKLKSQKKTVWRGINGNLSQEFDQGAKFIWWGISSCTESLNVLESEQFLGKTGTRTLFNIECLNGKMIKKHSYYPAEDEILLLPATQFEVVGRVQPAAGLYIVQLREVIPPIVFLKPPSGYSALSIEDATPETLPKPSKTLKAGNKDLANTEPVNVKHCTVSANVDTSLLVNLQNLRLSKTEKEMVATILSDSGTTLYIGSNQISFEGRKAIAEALKVNQTLITLNIEGNQISSEGGKAIAEALKVNQTLTTLYIGNNRISSEGGKAIAKALKVNQTLTTLNNEGNQISSEGGKAIAEALKVNRTLTTFNIWNNQISSEGGKAIAEALNVNQTLTTLNIGNNQISSEGGKATAEALKVNRTLTTLYIGNNQISSEGGKAIAEASKLNGICSVKGV
ncbi:unnamed protein product [Didymodactylos carnosus]|uniref:NAD(P)(+)--arginine ADP-ribosyltransferase n=1 Tax=Didymodactylos carnosus TaxID=1234261 RepID=A0A814HAX8_9BILA|nr:unnamed protein product [Didymodactylos carnosus]CAF1008349.1 unnamed protein product [Didymodactylos carnosus]CAF3746714.1 unnamed protein product [Didymodactylos carnosus]CAF3779468.1 unnamed protein product [Didymodactylos carnosus]